MQRWVPGLQFGKRRKASQENQPAELSCKAVAFGNIQGPRAVTTSVYLITNSETEGGEATEGTHRGH